ncbi:hypothetical protein Tco_0627020 [Tanacetum coccineum]|uniref:Uncharacterized protein n=1 Tax=Tanacetum coccineum TaxID=301880 RepID=A0ABQ4WLD3_9ASTR
MEVLAALRYIDHIHSMRFAQKCKMQIGQSKAMKTQDFDRFAKPSERRANIDMRFPKTISEDQSQDLEL